MKKNGFRTRMFGFHKKDVLVEIARLSETIAEKDEEMKALRQEVETTKAELVRANEEEKQKLADGLMAAQRTAEQLVAEAEEKAAAILADAEKAKVQILADAESAKTEVNDFRRQVRDVLRTMDEGLKHCAE
ncbi:MAG: DivIVA domain-containing protein [Clostridia bacterium]|nr:DivIVA domain-containing protein [Clostridia bacterium]